MLIPRVLFLRRVRRVRCVRRIMRRLGDRSGERSGYQPLRQQHRQGDAFFSAKRAQVSNKVVLILEGDYHRQHFPLEQHGRLGQRGDQKRSHRDIRRSDDGDGPHAVRADFAVGRSPDVIARCIRPPSGTFRCGRLHDIRARNDDDALNITFRPRTGLFLP